MRNFINLLLILITSVTLIGCSAGGGAEALKKITIEEDEIATGDLLLKTVSTASTYHVAGDVITFTAGFNKRVKVISGSPRLAFDLGGSTVYADYVSGHNTDTFTFTYTVLPGQNDLDGITTLSPLDLNGGDLEDFYGLDLTPAFTGQNFPSARVDTRAASYSSIVKLPDATYPIGETISFGIVFDENVYVTGSPRLEMQIDTGNQYLLYTGGSGTNTLTFEYTTTPLDDDRVSGIGLAGSIDLNGATINDIAGNVSNLGISPGSVAGIKLTNDVPHTITVDIDSGAVATNTTAVNLNISASNANEMYITNSSSSCVSGGIWEPYSTSKAWTIAQTNNTARVYIKFRTASLNESACYDADIRHDSIIPTAPSIVLGTDATTSAADTITLTGGSGTGTNIDYYEVAVSTTTSEANIVAGAGWQNIGTTSPYQYSGLTLTSGDPYYLLLKTVDEAGNERITSSALWYVLARPAKIRNLSLVSRTINSIRVAWTRPDANGPTITGYRLEYREGTSGAWIDLVTSYTGTSYNHTGLNDGTIYQYRVYSSNVGFESIASNRLQTETFPNIPAFSAAYMAVNVGGATQCQAVSLEENNRFELNGSLDAGVYDTGDLYTFGCAQFDELKANGKFYVAGRLSASGGTSAQKEANITWSPTSWVGRNFLFNHNRFVQANVAIYAYTNSTVTLTRGGVFVDSVVLTAGNSYVFTPTTYTSYEIASTGYIMGYYYAGTGTDHVDPKPLLPSSTDIIGIPSNSGRFTTSADSNNLELWSSGQAVTYRTQNTGSTYTYTPSGTRNRYQAHATRVISDSDIPIVGNSLADSNGYCTAPFVPTSWMRNTFGINVQSQWVAFASLGAAVITVTEPGNAPYTVTLARTQNDQDSPYKYYISSALPAGTVFESPTKFQAWYEPRTSTNGANDDETVLFGW